MRDWLATWVRFPRVIVLSILISALLLLPTLGLGFMLDDYVALAALDGVLHEFREPNPFKIFEFLTGNPEQISQRKIRGDLPWWTHPELKFSFCRPLSSWLFWLDYQVFGMHAWAAHLHSLLWRFALWAVWGGILWRVLPGKIGAVALLLCAIDESQFMASSWLSNRNALVAAVPVLLGLWAHIRWREDHWKPGLWLSLLGYAVGLSGGEAAIGALMYLAAYELLASPGGLP
ncbi:MAG: hypothetical protein N2C14_02895, partial [Planctomycetales bacterium]